MHLAVLATQPSTAARAYTLTVGGGDMNVTGQSGAAYKVPIDTIEIEEEGAGGASGMTFGVWDPNREIVLTESAVVEFWDVANALPLFKGFVQSWGMSGLVGRTLDVHCIGNEILLDWMVVPSLTIPDTLLFQEAVQSAVANATGIGVTLRVGASSAADGTQAEPIGDLGTSANIASEVVVEGETLRETIRQIIDATEVIGGGSEFIPVNAFFTVDFWSGLRVWRRSNTPDDYVNLTVTDVIGGGTGATVLDHETDAAGVPRGVFITGGNAAGTGLVSDGTGLPGPIATLSDDTILTTAVRDRVGVAYLADKATAIRGTLTIENFAPTTNIRAGSRVTITNTAAGLSAAAYPIFSITKRFIAAVQTWTVAYGGFRPSHVRQTRRQTRGVRS